MTTGERAESSGFCTNLGVCTVCAPSPSDIPDFPLLNQPNKSPKNILRCANAYVVNPEKVEIKNLMAVISDILGTLRLATTDYRRLDGRLLGLGRHKGFSPEPPS